ncbi:DNA polymerase-3 subunit epsilon [Actinomadura pelletieri DSM 43383]|uniref:DNA polymerase-3 subunit epsilon n=1 Tax=Actinomadura pelletieri DSM 43383 TaxID=1120940 RepID=A0A495QZ28_9ACTN|nr:exonuclease domain-containing protein [Actinomadura pelletieri]RKS79489.1 DNA polymerase-3 subunit epsilon [Actinomadura pelletieri DSM 43383]
MTAWTAIDFETANSLRGSPCSVGLAKVKEGQIVEEWSSLIRPPEGHDHFDAFNVGVHGITAYDVRDAPGWPETLERIVQFAGDTPLVAHNAAFDIGVLAAACEASGLPVPDLRFACTLVVARRTWTGLLAYKLPVLADALGIALPHHHNAGDDARAAAQVMLAALKRQGTSTLDELLAVHRIQMGSYRNGVRQGCRYRGAARREPFPDAAPDADPDNPFSGLTVCFTGSLPGMTRAAAAARITALGARTVLNVTRYVDLLVVGGIERHQLAPGARKTGKLAKAERLRESGHEITVIDAEEFFQLITMT